MTGHALAVVGNSYVGHYPRAIPVRPVIVVKDNPAAGGYKWTPERKIIGDGGLVMVTVYV